MIFSREHPRVGMNAMEKLEEGQDEYEKDVFIVDDIDEEEQDGRKRI
ncbi:hypothetical protein HanIR_Chr13g0634411 [Helianthus annuus]|nr:hypothetical protein HanIR_Chr13g0634411 [Helianthus annuus]